MAASLSVAAAFSRYWPAMGVADARNAERDFLCSAQRLFMAFCCANTFRRTRQPVASLFAFATTACGRA